MKAKILYDVLIIGGGPAGMMAGVTAGRLGAKVLIIEKNSLLGKKLRITGGGRCNITNAEFNYRTLATAYGPKGKFLLSPFARFGAEDTLKFFDTLGVPTKIEAEKRAFPASNSALEVTTALIDELKNLGVTILTNTQVKGFEVAQARIASVATSKGTFHAKTYILATGGTARPETGSTGEGLLWLKKLGHTINKPDTALVPIVLKETWTHTLQGLSLPHVKLSILGHGKLKESKVGKILFTHFGLSGPLALGMSRTIGETLSEGDTGLTLDLFPHLDHRMLDESLLAHLRTVQNREWKNALKGFLPARLAPLLALKTTIPEDRFVNKVSRTERLAFVKYLKQIPLTPTRLLGADKAISSSGGVVLEEVDFKTMQSLKVPNLYIVGDALDFNRPSGGFSLQICWATGFVAGEHATHKHPPRAL